MSSKNAVYESSMLWGFDVEGELTTGCFFATGRGGAIDCLVGKTVGDALDFDFGRADSLLTRTDAGTWGKTKNEPKD